MPEWDEETKHFMTYWFSGLLNGLESVDMVRLMLKRLARHPATVL
jgi:hypothetical protein